MTRPRVAVLHLGRSSAMGEGRRVDTWRVLFTAAGADVYEVTLIPPGKGRRPHFSWSDFPDLATNTVVPEVLAWPASRAAVQLHGIAPDITIFVTARAFRPALAVGRLTVIDFVDELSTSYRQRAKIRASNSLNALGYRLLAEVHRRFERRRRPAIHRVAAGFDDAHRLNAEWVPVLAPVLPRSDHLLPKQADLLFLGNLEYPPNVDAVRELDRLWISLPTGTTLLLAGRAPTEEVQAIARRRGWKLLRDFPDLEALRGVASLAVAPLAHTAGIQMKVLDAAALGIPQLVSPAALRGMEPGFPAGVAELGRPFETALLKLLREDKERERLGRAAADQVASRYGVEAWAPWARRLLSEGPC